MKKKNIKRHAYGYVKDDHDERDHYFSAPLPIVTTLPLKVDLRPTCPPVYDQGKLGACTANAIAGHDEFDQMLQKEVAFTPSRLFIYRGERVMEGTVNQDAGAQIRDGIKFLAASGVCPESMWPYIISKFRDAPPKACFDEAMKHQALTYSRVVQTLGQLKGCLAAGFPFVFGFQVYESFESAAVAKTGKMPMPKSYEQCLGGHAVMAVGYDDAQQRFIIRNSWGEKWGDKGYFTMPYAFIINPKMCSDFWTIRLVE